VDVPVEKPRSAWQPFTPTGLAAFANASWRRLLLVQLIFALIAAALIVWFLAQDWFPIISRAVESLPQQGEINRGTLDWRGESPTDLADNVFLGLAVDLNHSGGNRFPAHVQVEFGKRDIKFFSLFGYWKMPYPAGYRIAFNRVELVPWWGAWAPPLLAIAAVSVVVALLLSWIFLATIYFLPGWLIGFFANRAVTLRGCWLLSGAALMPGAIFLSGALLFYSLGFLDVLRLMLAGALHLLIGWGYVIAGTLALPRDRAAYSGRTNPFARPGIREAGASPVKGVRK
jgi:hypothetical protein